MTRLSLFAAGFLALAVAVAYFVQSGDLLPETKEISMNLDIEAGEQLYANSCAACHGANLEGQPEWRSAGPDGKLPAPPHDRTGHTWHHSDSVLFDYTKLGGSEVMKRQGIEFESGMPAFGDILSDEEILNILAYIKSTWPDRERLLQAERTNAEQR